MHINVEISLPRNFKPEDLSKFANQIGANYHSVGRSGSVDIGNNGEKLNYYENTATNFKSNHSIAITNKNGSTVVSLSINHNSVSGAMYATVSGPSKTIDLGMKKIAQNFNQFSSLLRPVENAVKEEVKRQTDAQKQGLNPSGLNLQKQKL